MNNITNYNQYKNDIFNKLAFHFETGSKLLDVGCGDGTDAEIFINEFNLDVYGIDVYKDDNIDKIAGLKFKQAGIHKIPFTDDYFDYIYLHDVLHHIDEDHQDYSKHISALKELKRVVKNGGSIVIVEGNRYNPLFYPHMVKMHGHNHFRQNYFNRIINEVFLFATFKYFEAHLYPKKYLKVWKIYEYIMESIMPRSILAYNVAIINKINK